MGRGRPIIIYIASSENKQVIGSCRELAAIFDCTSNYIRFLTERGTAVKKDNEVYYFDILLEEEEF